MEFAQYAIIGVTLLVLAVLAGAAYTVTARRRRPAEPPPLDAEAARPLRSLHPLRSRHLLRLRRRNARCRSWRCRSRPPAGWCASVRACPVRSRPSARACSRCSPATGSTRTSGRRSRTRSSPPTSASPPRVRSSSGCASGRRCSAPARPAELRALLAEELVARDRQGHRPHPAHHAARRASGGADDGRRQRGRQDHDLRKGRPSADRGRPHGAARRRRHVPRRRRRPAPDLG